MEETPVVTVFLRQGSDVLLLRRSEDVRSYQGRWGAVAGHAAGDPPAAARREIAEQTGLDPVADATLVREGEAFSVAHADLGTRWLVHPFLYETAATAIEPNWETAAWDWTSPTVILERETVPELWTSYDRVRPGIETVAEDRTHGSSWLSRRALEVLRDEAALARTARSDAPGPADLRETATALGAARPAMPGVRNRVDRAMAEALGGGDEESEGRERPAPDPAALGDSASAGLERAERVDDETAAVAAERIDGRRVATLSRSGTVVTALARGDPAAVLVAESRPGGEGVGVAADLHADGNDVTLTSDAAIASQLARWGADVLLVGADAVLPDGHVVNKVGTRGAAIAASAEGVAVAVAAATDTVDAETDDPAAVAREHDAMAPLAAGGAAVPTANPTFDVTPAAVIDTVLTADGALDPSELEAVAAGHRERAAWRRGP